MNACHSSAYGKESALNGRLQKLLRDPAGCLYRFLLRKYLRHVRLRGPGIHVSDPLYFRGKPLIEVAPGARLVIGKEVLLDSQNQGYVANMHSPVKIVVWQAGAIVEIGEKSRIHGTCLSSRGSIRIGKRCLIAGNCQILDWNGHDLSFEDVEQRVRSEGTIEPVVIEDDVWLGLGSIVLPGVTIGRGTVVAAGSVVSRSLPPMVLAGGVPARVIRYYGGNKSDDLNTDRLV